MSPKRKESLFSSQESIRTKGASNNENTFRIRDGNFLSLPENPVGVGFYWFEPYQAICYQSNKGDSFIAVYYEGGKYVKHNAQSIPKNAHDALIEMLNKGGTQ